MATRYSYDIRCALARTVEHFRIPRNVLTIGLGKRTYAGGKSLRNITPLEPE